MIRKKGKLKTKELLNLQFFWPLSKRNVSKVVRSSGKDIQGKKEKLPEENFSNNFCQTQAVLQGI